MATQNHDDFTQQITYKSKIVGVMVPGMQGRDKNFIHVNARKVDIEVDSDHSIEPFWHTASRSFLQWWGTILVNT